MAVPPEQISIKRRRQDEPVEILYLESNSHPSKRRFTDFFFQRVRSDTSSNWSNEGARQPRSVDIPKVGSQQCPTTPQTQAQTTQAASNFQEMNRTRDNLSDVQVPLRPYIPSQEYIPEADINDDQKDSRLSAFRHDPSPRRFHLSRLRSASGDRHISTFKSALSKSQPRLAIFVEQDNELSSGPSVAETSKSKHQIEALEADSVAETNHLNPPVRRKRPGPYFSGVNPRPTRAKDREKSQPAFVETSRGDRISADEVNQDSALLREMQEMALEAIEADTKTRASGDIRGMRPATTMVAEHTRATEPDDGFIYETYLRYPISIIKSPDDTKSTEAERYGVLVVNEDDEEVWNMSTTSDEDTEWDEDDPDSNAEDNPNNDYPEDDLDSDDEFGEGAYAFRHGASDDEQYDFERDDYD